MMSKSKLNTFCRVSTLLGGFVLCLPDGGFWSWGNMSVYVLSYMRMAGVSGSDLESPWLLSLYIVAETIALMVAGSVCSVLGRRLTTVIGVLLLDGGLFTTYFTVVQNSMLGLNITGGVLTGFGFGLIYSMVLLYVIDWADKSSVGFFIAVISTAMTIGGSLSNELVSRFANPDNESPDLPLGPIKLFTKIDVLDRVPSIYLVLGGSSLFLHVVGLALIRDKPVKARGSQSKEKSTDESTRLQSGSPVAKYVEEKGFLNGTSIDSKEHSKQLSSEEETTFQREPSIEKYSDENQSCKSSGGNDSMDSKTSRLNNTEAELNSTEILKANFETLVSNEEISDSECHSDMAVGGDVSPSEMLRNKTFFILWMVLVCNDFGYVVFANYYKLFGQLFINNDHSLADVGTAITISVASTRVAWGIMIDKLGVKWVMIIFAASFSLLFSFYFFTSMLAPWYYYVCSVLLACVDSGLHANFSVATLKYFGTKHFTFNMGLVMSATILLNVAAPPLLQLLLHRWGWFVLFITSAVVNFISLLFTCYGLPTV